MPETIKKVKDYVKKVTQSTVKAVKGAVPLVRKPTYRRVRDERDELLKSRNQDNTNSTEQV